MRKLVTDKKLLFFLDEIEIILGPVSLGMYDAGAAGFSKMVHALQFRQGVDFTAHSGIRDQPGYAMSRTGSSGSID